MKKNENLYKLINYYLENEIEHFMENYEYNEDNIDNHILGTWYKVICELPEGKDFVESSKMKIKNDLENPMVTYFDGKNTHYIPEKEIEDFEKELSTLIKKL